MGAAPSELPVAFVGLGAMGSGIAARLLSAGFPVTVANRTAGKADELVRAGAAEAATPAKAAHEAKIVMLSLSDEHAVEDVLFGADGVLAGAEAGTIVVDTSTVSPAGSRMLTERLRERSVSRVEACVVGNPLQAREGELRVFAAGSGEEIARVRPLLDVIGKQVLELGGTGAGAVLKIVFNTLLGTQLSTLAEALGVATAAGLDPGLVLGAIAGSGFSSQVLSFRIQLLRQGKLEPAAFKSALMAKDLRLAKELAAEAGLSMSTVDAAAAAFDAVVAAGLGDRDAAAVCAAPPAADRAGA